MKCSDISDESVVSAIESCTNAEIGVAFTWDVVARLESQGAQKKVALAKLYNMIRKGRIHGCVHGTGIMCRGDLHVPVEGIACPPLC